uniref:Protein kinase domain-containing protein n=1 Tax=Tetradesmus obliquus TaxID=3088 RepID=A0A383VVN5_TETOB
MRAALASPQYDTILLTHDVSIRPWLWPAGDPLRLSRNITLTTANFSQAAGNYASINFEFLEGRALIAKNVTVTVRDIALGRARRSSGQGIPFFAGEGASSVLLMENVVRLRLACAPSAADLVATLQATPRAPPGRGVTDAASNKVDLSTFTYKGIDYPGSLRASDVSSIVSPGDVADTQAYYAGYSVQQLNTTRVCLSYVSEACVAEKGGDLCVNEVVNALLAEEAAARQGGRRGVNVAAIAAPVVVAGVLLLAALAAVLLYYKRKKRRMAAAAAESVAAAAKSAKEGYQPQPPPSASAGSKGLQDESNPSDIIGARGGAAGTLESLAVGSRGGGWQLLACHTCPEFRDASPNDKIRLGVLLGAGSFGRVYKGVWRDLAVAVKVLQHDSTTAAAVANEVDLVMSFRHPNIVAAYHFVTWAQSDSADDSPPLPQQQQQQQHYGQPSTANSMLTASSNSLLLTPNSRRPSSGTDELPSAVMRRKMQTVTESSSIYDSSKQSFPKPPGVVVTGSTLGSTPCNTVGGSTPHVPASNASAGSSVVGLPLVSGFGSTAAAAAGAGAAAAAAGTGAGYSSTATRQGSSGSSRVRSAGAPEPAAAPAPAPAAESDMPAATTAAAAAAAGSNAGSSTAVVQASDDASDASAAANAAGGPELFVAIGPPSGKVPFMLPQQQQCMAAQQQLDVSAPLPAFDSTPAAAAAVAEGNEAETFSLSAPEHDAAAAAASLSGSSNGLRPIKTSSAGARRALTNSAASPSGDGTAAAAAAAAAGGGGAGLSAAGWPAAAAAAAGSTAGLLAGAGSTTGGSYAAGLTGMSYTAGSAAGMVGVAGFGTPPPSTARSNAAGHHAVQLIPFMPQQQQQQQQSGPHSASNGSAGQQLQQQQQSDHVVVVRPGFVQLNQPQHGGAVNGSGWKTVGDDLEMDEFGNMYTTGGNATATAGRQGSKGSGSATGGGGGGRRGGGAARGGKATEAQTWLILEFCDGGTLLDLLTDGRLESSRPGGGRKMALALTLLCDIASGMNYLHSRSVIHGDLKPGNVLIKHEQGAPYGRVAKVSDFGLSRALQVGQSHKSTRTMGTMNHTPPELLRLGRLSPAGDVYAFGILMWEVFTSKIAFSGLHYGEVFEQVALWQKRPPVPPEMPQDYAELMAACWAADPFSRPSFAAVEAKLAEQLTSVMQDSREAQERFISDL